MDIVHSASVRTNQLKSTTRVQHALIWLILFFFCDNYTEDIVLILGLFFFFIVHPLTRKGRAFASIIKQYKTIGSTSSYAERRQLRTQRQYGFFAAEIGVFYTAHKVLWIYITGTDENQTPYWILVYCNGASFCRCGFRINRKPMQIFFLCRRVLHGEHRSPKRGHWISTPLSDRKRF